MAKDRNQPVGKRALLGAILARHIDPRVDLIATDQLALEAAADAAVEAVPEAVEPAEAKVEASEAAAQPTNKKSKATKSKAGATKYPTPNPEKKSKWWRRPLTHHQQSKILVAICLVILLLVAPLAGAYNYYDQRVLPGMKVAGLPVGGKTIAELRQTVSSEAASLSLSVHNGDTVLHPSLSEVGISVDVDGTVQSTYQNRRSDSVQQRLAWWKSKNVPLRITIDQDKLTAFNRTISPQSYKPAADAKVIFAGSGYVVTPEKTGQNTGIQSAVQGLASGITKSEAIDLTVADEVIQPKISAAELQTEVSQANAFLSTPISLTYAGRNYAPTKDQVSDWITLGADPAKQPYTATIDSAKVAAYVDGIAKQLYVSPVDQLVGKNQDQGGAEQILTAGRNGRQLNNKADVTSAVLAALDKSQSLQMALNVSEAPFKVTSINSYDRYVDVSLSTRRLTAFEKGVAVASFPTSSGDRLHPTPPGVYTIYGKTASQTMYGGSKIAGDYFYLPNVQWISWWYGPYAIHGAYWNHVIGVADTSHGCINMSNADAKFIYDWAPIGTKVVIHV